MKILLAEDDANVSTIIQLVLERIGGHQVTVVEDGEAALSMALATASSQPFDLLILDGMMPKRTGLSVCKELRTRGYADLPVIFLSAKSEEKEIAEFLQFGNGYLAKPFDPQTICQRIDEILAKHRRRVS